MTQRRALVLGVTGNLDFAAGAVVAAFLRHNPGFAGDIVVLHDGLPAASAAALARLAHRVVLVTLDRSAVLARLLAAGLDQPGSAGPLGRHDAGQVRDVRLA